MSKLTSYDVILFPVITEKSTLVLELSNQVVFRVAPKATKPEIKRAVEELFKVKVKAVNTLVRKGKLKSFRGIRALQSDTKKAVVTLEPGYSIDIGSGI
jgi:large subunit ribosomal protein L23